MPGGQVSARVHLPQASSSAADGNIEKKISRPSTTTKDKGLPFVPIILRSHSKGPSHNKGVVPPKESEKSNTEDQKQGVNFKW